MKHSKINKILLEAEQFIKACGFFLPAFTQWTVKDWQNKGLEISRIVENGLGWDVTDFGSGHFQKRGLFLFTLRNGSHSGTGGIPYAEKIMVVAENQFNPMHFHWKKSENHTFWGTCGRVLVGKVSPVNDDPNDNRFDWPEGRFPLIEEDCKPVHLWVGNCARYYRQQVHP